MLYHNRSTTPALARLNHFVRLSLCALLAAIINAQSAYAQSGNDALVDLTPSGWTRITDLEGISVDRYRTASGSMNIELIAFPPTTESAKQWLDGVLATMLKQGRDEGRKINIINDDEVGGKNVRGPMNSSGDGVDIATRSFVMIGTESNAKILIRNVRAIIRPDQPVQLSILSLDDAKTNDEDWQLANSLRFRANLPYNKSAAFLGLDAMVGVMTEPLLYSRKTKALAQTSQQPSEKALKQAQKRPERKPAVLATKPAVVKSNAGNLAPTFAPLPGPQVKLTGKWLSHLPAGYRMHVRTKNYWTNSSMTSTRTLFLALSADGQFEVGSFSIMGGMGGVVGSVFTHDKNGSSGAVYGDTNFSGAGTKSTAITKRKGLDPSKYGVYHISGNKIEFRYANGKVVTQSLKTDGYSELVIDGKRYFTGTPNGWEKRDDGKKVTQYRSINGAYLVKVSSIRNNIGNGHQWMRDFLGRLKEKDYYTSATEIKGYKGATANYNVVRTTVVGKNDSGAGFSTDFYVKYGRSSNRLVQVDRYAGAKPDNTLLTFIRYVD